MAHKSLSLDEQYANWYEWLKASGALKSRSLEEMRASFVPRRVVFRPLHRLFRRNREYLPGGLHGVINRLWTALQRLISNARSLFTCVTGRQAEGPRYAGDESGKRQRGRIRTGLRHTERHKFAFSVCAILAIR
jgi:hypothetical protein